jgi:hypothetical protein
MAAAHRKNGSLCPFGTGSFESRSAPDCGPLFSTKEETIMFYALGWFVVVTLLALWSLGAWAVHAITAWTVSQAGTLAGGAGAAQDLRLPEWLAPWMPPELAAALESMAAALGPAIETLLGWAPALEGGLSVAIWVIWGLGSAMLVALGFVATALVAVLRRRASAPATASARAAGAH